MGATLTHRMSNLAGARQATRLDAIRGHFDPWLLGVSIALACFGLVMVASSSISIWSRSASRT